MELWELFRCLEAYNKKQQSEHQERITLAWQTAAFSGKSFNGKLKKLSHYLPNSQKTPPAPRVSKDEFEAKLSKAQATGRRASEWP